VRKTRADFLLIDKIAAHIGQKHSGHGTHTFAFNPVVKELKTSNYLTLTELLRLRILNKIRLESPETFINQFP